MRDICGAHVFLLHLSHFFDELMRQKKNGKEAKEVA